MSCSSVSSHDACSISKDADKREGNTSDDLNVKYKLTISTGVSRVRERVSVNGSDKRRPCDWLPERVRLRYVFGSGLRAMFSKKNSFLVSFIPNNRSFID